jgi:hypothetical protein
MVGEQTIMFQGLLNQLVAAAAQLPDSSNLQHACMMTPPRPCRAAAKTFCSPSLEDITDLSTPEHFCDAFADENVPLESVPIKQILDTFDEPPLKRPCHVRPISPPGVDCPFIFVRVGGLNSSQSTHGLPPKCFQIHADNVGKSQTTKYIIQRSLVTAVLRSSTREIIQPPNCQVRFKPHQESSFRDGLPILRKLQQYDPKCVNNALLPPLQSGYEALKKLGESDGVLVLSAMYKSYILDKYEDYKVSNLYFDINFGVPVVPAYVAVELCSLQPDGVVLVSKTFTVEAREECAVRAHFHIDIFRDVEDRDIFRCKKMTRKQVQTMKKNLSRYVIRATHGHQTVQSHTFVVKRQGVKDAHLLYMRKT